MTAAGPKFLPFKAPQRLLFLFVLPWPILSAPRAAPQRFEQRVPRNGWNECPMSVLPPHPLRIAFDALQDDAASNFAITSGGIWVPPIFSGSFLLRTAQTRVSAPSTASSPLTESRCSTSKLERR